MRQKGNAITVLTAVLLSAWVGVASPSPQALKAALPPAKKPTRVVESELLLGQGEITQKTTAEMISMLKGFQSLIKSEVEPEKKAKLQLSQASTYLTLARQYRSAEKSKSGKVKKNSTEASQRAIGTLLPVIGDQRISPPLQARAHYLKGIAHLNLGQEKDAAASFSAAITLQPTATYAPALSLFLIETEIEQDHFQKALDLIQTHMTSYNESQKVLAIYKAAWCYVNLDNPNQAEKNFLMIAGKEAAGPFGHDALKDLAYLVTLHRDEKDIIRFSKENFKTQETQSEFLVQVYSYFQSQSTTKRKPEILAELTKNEKDPVKRLRILIATLKGMQRDYAAAEPFLQFKEISGEIDRLTWKTSLPGWTEMASDLEQELFHLIQAHVDTLNNKVKSPDPITTNIVADHLVETLAFHAKYYPNSSEHENTMQTWLRVCDEQKNARCASLAAAKILEEKKLSPALKQSALFVQLKALDNLAAEDPAAKEKLKKALESYLSEKKPDKDWYQVAKRLTTLLNETKNYKASIPWLEKIHQSEQSTESFFRLQSARYQNEDYLTVANSQFRLTEDQFSQDARVLAREAHLKIAQKNLKGDNFEAYAQSVVEFLKTNPDPERADLARKSLIEQYAQRKMWKNATEQLMIVKPQNRVKDYAATSALVGTALLKQGDFSKAHQIVDNWTPKSGAAELEPIVTASEIATGRPIHAIHDDKVREYHLGQAALGNPGIAIRYFELNKTKTEADKKILLLALQVEKRTMTPVLTAKQKVLLKGFYEGIHNLPPAPTLKSLKAIAFPSPKMPKASYESTAQAAAEKVRALRPLIAKDLEGQSPESQLQLLAAAQEAEKRVASSLLKAPLPDGIEKSQIVEYKKAIADLASEFQKQGTEYEKITAKIRARVNSEPTALAFPDLGQWPTYKSDLKEVLGRLIEQGQATAALFVLDQWRADNTITADAHAEMRCRLLFSLGTNPAVSNYLASELVATGQKDLLEKWKSLIKVKGN